MGEGGAESAPVFCRHVFQSAELNLHIRQGAVLYPLEGLTEFTCIHRPVFIQGELNGKVAGIGACRGVSRTVVSCASHEFIAHARGLRRDGLEQEHKGDDTHSQAQEAQPLLCCLVHGVHPTATLMFSQLTYAPEVALALTVKLPAAL